MQRYFSYGQVAKAFAALSDATPLEAPALSADAMLLADIWATMVFDEKEAISSETLPRRAILLIGKHGGLLH